MRDLIIVTSEMSPDRSAGACRDRDANALLAALYVGMPEPTGQRVNHAAGIMAEGFFEGSDDAARLSGAEIFQERAAAAMVRFSNSGGPPGFADDDPRANPRGAALRLVSSGGSTTDFVGHSADGFPAATPEEFLAFLAAVNARRDDPAALDRHLANHAAAARFVATLPTTPAGYTFEDYHMLHSYVLVAADGSRTVGRLHIAPDVRLAGPSDAQLAGKGATFLRNGLRAVLDAGIVRMHLDFEHRTPGDRTDDISSPWPEGRRRTRLGTLTVDRVVPEGKGERMMFDPGRLAPGIEAAGDPMLEIRSATYRASLARRRSERHALQGPA